MNPSGDANWNGGLFDLFRARFPVDRRRPFIETAAGRIFSYAQMEAMVARLAGRLRALGLGKGERVAVQVEKSPESVFLYLAALRAGAALVPLNPAYTAAEIAYFLADCQPGVFVCAPSRADELAPVARAAGVARVPTLGDAGEGSLLEGLTDGDGAFPVRGANDLAAILYTSGTTGRSKGAMLSHGNLAANALALHRIWGFGPGDTLLHALPLFHTHGLFVALNCVLLNGTGMIFLERFEAGSVLDALPRATVMMGVPTFYTRLLAEPRLTPELCRGVRLFISGSAPLLAETHRAFQARTGQVILERYGMTETGMLTSNPLEGERVPGTVGFPLPGVSLRVTGETGGIEAGGIEVKGPNVFSGYWRMPEKTAEEFTADGFFKTGDVGRIDEAGYLHIVGRARDLIISGGFNVYPKEVETVVDGLDGVGESAVIGLPHPDFGEAVVAVIQPKPGRAPPDEAGVIAACEAVLANFKRPKRVVALDELPRNAMGKVEKNRLRARYADLFQGG